MPILYKGPSILTGEPIVAILSDRGAKVLEPSAGTGRLLDALLADDGADVCITAVESDSRLAEHLGRVYGARLRTLAQADFLTIDPELLGGPFDVIVMNPPFKRGVDIKHIQRAIALLEPGGILVAVCADGPDRREAFAEYGYEPLPAGSFAEEGTNVNTALVVVR